MCSTAEADHSGLHSLGGLFRQTGQGCSTAEADHSGLHFAPFYPRPVRGMCSTAEADHSGLHHLPQPEHDREPRVLNGRGRSQRAAQKGGDSYNATLVCSTAEADHSGLHRRG